jgi:cytochrome bd ubiquinol oxidase subunit II
MAETLASAWVVIIGFCIIMYVLLDGFDLGVGILFPFFPDKHDRSIMVSSVLPVWDGNQTWLVLGAASLYGAFPKAFSLLLPALYFPIFMMVIALLLRGITFEFRLKAKKSLWFWDFIFFLSSSLTTFAQGLLLGSFVKGFEINTDGITLNYHLFTLFNVTCGIALLFGYALLGSTWIIAKTTGNLQERMFKIALICLCMVSSFLLLISAWSPFIDNHIAEIWFNPNYFFKLAILPITTGIVILYSLRCIQKRREYVLFWLSISIFLCAYIGFGISSWPYLIPHIMTFWQAAAPASSLLFMLFGALLLLPVLVGYTSYSYYIFRGKITEAIGY